MGSREIFALRKQGRSDEALEMARAEFPQNRGDVWFVRAYAWSLYDRTKAIADRYTAKQVSGPALSGEFASLLNEFADMADPLRGDMAFSQMLRLAGKVSRDWDDFLLFARWVGVDSFSADDEKPFVTDDGKTIDSLKVRFTRAICRETAARVTDGRTDTELIEWGQTVLDQALLDRPDDQWLNYYQAQLHLARREPDEALRRLMPVLQRQSRAAWPWALLAGIIEPARPADSLTCLIHAANLARKEQEVAKVRIRLATQLARAERYDEAALQANLVLKWRTQNEYRVPPALQQLLASDWYKQSEAAKSFRKLPRVDAAAHKLLRDLDPSPLIYTLGVIESINTKKSLSYAATSADTGFVLLHNAFPKFAELTVGTIVEIGHRASDHHAQDWRPSTAETIPGLCEHSSGTLTRRDGQAFAFVRSELGDVFVPPALAERFSPGARYQVACKVLLRTDKKKKQPGWCALEVSTATGAVRP